MFQEEKARQIFRKTNISYPLICTRTCAYQGVRNVRFLENLACFVFLKHPFWDPPFCLITDEIPSPVLIVANQTCMKHSSLPKYYDQDYMKNYLLHFNDDNSTFWAYLCFCSKTTINQSWKLSIVNFWHKPNMWNSVFIKLIKLKYFLHLFSLYFHWTPE